MLTKDLVICRCSGKRILPVFQKTDDAELLEMAERLIGSCELNGIFTRGEMNQAWDDVTTGFFNTKLANGLRKILEDRALFTSSAELDYPTERKKVLLASASLLSQGGFSTEKEYRQNLEERIDSPLARERLYADLPDNDRLLSFRDTSPRELIERYNLALVQGLLLDASSIELDVEDASQAQLRRLFSLVRFNRLVSMAEAKAPKNQVDSHGETTRIHFTIDGPGSILNQSRSYGFQLARFFPSVVNLKHWELKAIINHTNAYGSKERELRLDETSGLTCRDAYGSYVPEEIGLFRKAFAAKNSRWHFLEECPLLKGPKGLLVFPDFGFTSPDGKTIYLELFHRWHANQLMQRLDQLDCGSEWPLIIGVDRAIAAKPDFQERLENSPAFQKAGFLYRDFPTVDRLVSRLEQISG
ncbi:MAG: DUF790 family protein [Victivallales bacterium]|nr:DUF790 family protein [Victivallales bacterium]